MRYYPIRTLLLVSSLAYFSSSKAITLEEALPLAYKKSDSLKASEETFIQEIQVMSEAIAGFMPRADAKIQFSNTKTPYNRAGAGPGNPNDDISKSQTISVSQPIFNGGSSVADLKSAQYQFRASRAKFYKAEQDFLLKAIETYLNLYESEQKYKIATDSLDFRTHELKAAEERLKLGEETITNVAAARAKLAQAQAKKASQYAELESNKAEFRKTFGVEPEEISVPSVPSGLPEDLDSMIKTSLASDYSIEAVKNTVQVAKSDAYSTTASYLLPSVSLSGSFSRTQYSTERPALQQTNSKSVTTALSVNIPILSKGGAEYAAIRRSRSKARQLVHSMDESINATKVAALGLWGQYEALKSSLVFADEYVKAQTMALDGAKQEYEIGAKTMLDVFQIEDDYNSAKINSVTTQKSYINTAYKILSYSGRVTAKAMKLKVKCFNPDSEFKKVKVKFIGF